MNYPFVTAKGETIISDKWLLENIRENCGDDVAEMVESRMDIYAGQEMFLRNLLSDISEVQSNLSDLDMSLEGLCDTVKKRLKP